jgi:hypothetical protein
VYKNHRGGQQRVSKPFGLDDGGRKMTLTGDT